MQILHATGSELDDHALADWYAEKSPNEAFVRLNMVATVDGSAHGEDGLSGTINTRGDNRVFAMLRAWADVILVGAGTVAAEGYEAAQTDPRWRFLREGRPAHPAMAVLTHRGQLPPTTPDGGDVFAVKSTRGGLRGVIAELRGRGHRRILCEGGPHVAAQLVAEGLVDELCVSVSPLTLGGPAGRILDGVVCRTEWRLSGLLEDDSTLLSRWHPAR